MTTVATLPIAIESSLLLLGPLTITERMMVLLAVKAHEIGRAGHEYFAGLRLLLSLIGRGDPFPLIVEFISIFFKVMWVIVLLFGIRLHPNSGPYKVLSFHALPAGIWIWAVVPAILVVLHLISIRSKRLDYRAYSLIGSFLWWAWFAEVFRNYGLNLAHLPSVPMAGFCLLATFSLALRARPRGGDGEGHGHMG